MCRRKRGKQTAQTVNKPHAPQIVQMTGTAQMHPNAMYHNGPRMSAVQQPMQQPIQQPMQQPYQQPMQQPYQQPMHNTGMGQPVVVHAQHMQPYGNNQVPIMMNQGTPVVVQAGVQPANVRQSL